ncbi:MAG: DUF1622 domain-containing protein [Bacillota bacterium]|nr:DUF1622 domain-containing protein [Bacillota bacterium]MDW7684159.1 DUF1622 domain-containing protein [Bacillota bacterium]
MNIHAVEELMSEMMLLAVHMLEIFGATIILFAGTRIFIRFLRTSKDGRETRLSFARYLVFGLEFKMAGEILRTVIVRTMNEVIILAAIIFLRLTLNLIVHWEIRQEKQDDERHSS